MVSKLNIIQKTGSWFSYNDEKIGQGKANAIAFVEQHPEVYAEVEQQVKDAMADIGSEE